MRDSHISDELADAMAKGLGFPGTTGECHDARQAEAFRFALEQVNAWMKQAMDGVAGHMIKMADAMDEAGFPQVADMLDAALLQRSAYPQGIAGIIRKASAYEDFKRALDAVAPGDCAAVHGIYRKYSALLEAEDSFMRARQDCLAKCPSFKPGG
jgi:hypothetical protein